MAKNVELLLTENVEALGIVGDVVRVRTGYARNFLLPRAFATTPSPEKIQELAGKRAEAERQLAELRKQREDIINRLKDYTLEVIRSCNDQGILYGGVTQTEISAELVQRGFGIRARDVRLAQVIKRVGTYDLHIKFESDLDATIHLKVQPDRKLDLHEDAPAEQPAEAPAEEGGEPAAAEAGEKPKKSKKAREAEAAEAAAAPAKAEKSDKAEKADKGEKKAKGDKAKSKKE